MAMARPKFGRTQLILETWIIIPTQINGLISLGHSTLKLRLNTPLYIKQFRQAMSAAYV